MDKGYSGTGEDFMRTLEENQRNKESKKKTRNQKGIKIEDLGGNSSKLRPVARVIC